MIGKNVQIFCCEDISLVENYEKAVNGPEMWDCHHKLETDLGLSKNELKEQGKYFNVPASELIFLTHSEHQILHRTGKPRSEETKKKLSDANRGKHHSEETRQILSEQQKQRFKDPEERKKAGDHTRNCPWMNNGVTECRPKNQEEIEYYRELGYRFGRK